MIYPWPNLFRIGYTFCPNGIRSGGALTDAVTGQIKRYFAVDLALSDFDSQSFVLWPEKDELIIYSDGEAGFRYGILACAQLRTKDGQLRECRAVSIPQCKRRQVVLRCPGMWELDVVLRLLEEVARLGYNEVYFLDCANSSATSVQRRQLQDACSTNLMQTNLTDSNLTLATYELDASRVVGFELRIRYPYLDRIENCKISWTGAYEVSAMAASGFLFRLSLGALALRHPDYSAMLWEKALPAALADCHAMAARLHGQKPVIPDQTVPLKGFAGRVQASSEPVTLAASPDGWAELRVWHALGGVPTGADQAAAGFDGATAASSGLYQLTYDDGSTERLALHDGVNIGCLNADWSHRYNADLHLFDVDTSLQQICCSALPHLTMGADGAPQTFYELRLSRPDRRIAQLALLAAPGVDIALHRIDAVFAASAEET